MGRIKKNYNKSKITKLKELISELESELIQIINGMGQTKKGFQMNAHGLNAV